MPQFLVIYPGNAEIPPPGMAVEIRAFRGDFADEDAAVEAAVRAFDLPHNRAVWALPASSLTKYVCSVSAAPE